MNDETLKEACPSCQKGTLTAVEESADGDTKEFSCGHRHSSIQLTADVSFRESLGLKGKHVGTGRPFIEAKAGVSFSKKARRWMQHSRTINREKNQYKEVVIDPETGKVIHKCEEPLSQHREHGSAKKKSD